MQSPAIELPYGEFYEEIPCHCFTSEWHNLMTIPKWDPVTSMYSLYSTQKSELHGSIRQLLIARKIHKSLSF